VILKADLSLMDFHFMKLLVISTGYPVIITENAFCDVACQP
jgi:hypothetical protein